VLVVEPLLESLGLDRVSPQRVGELHVAVGLEDEGAGHRLDDGGLGHLVGEAHRSAQDDDVVDAETGLAVGELLFGAEQFGVRHGFLRWVVWLGGCRARR
jgi:hypothetical protein